MSCPQASGAACIRRTGFWSIVSGVRGQRQQPLQRPLLRIQAGEADLLVLLDQLVEPAGERQRRSQEIAAAQLAAFLDLDAVLLLDRAADFPPQLAIRRGEGPQPALSDGRPDVRAEGEVRIEVRAISQRGAGRRQGQVLDGVDARAVAAQRAHG
jgi:hypothetical protein